MEFNGKFHELMKFSMEFHGKFHELTERFSPGFIICFFYNIIFYQALGLDKKSYLKARA
jgi:hypothetical protein